MASFIRIFNRHKLLKAHVIIPAAENILFRNAFFVSQPFVSVFENERKNIEPEYVNKLDETRTKLADCLNKPNNQEILKDDLYKMLHIVKTDQDIDLIVKIIKMGNISYVENKKYSTVLMDLLYSQAKTDKIYELFFDKEFDKYLMDSRSVYIISSLLYEQARYSQVIEVFDKFCTFNGTFESQLNSLINVNLAIVLQSLYQINTKEAYDKMKKILDSVSPKKLNIVSIACVVLIAHNHNDFSLANRVINQSKQDNFIISNLKIIIDCSQGNVEKALQTAEKLLKQTTKINIKKFFPFTLKSLNEAVKSSNKSEHIDRLNKLNSNLQKELNKVDLPKQVLKYNSFFQEESQTKNKKQPAPVSVPVPVPVPVPAQDKNSQPEPVVEKKNPINNDLSAMNRLYSDKNYTSLVDYFEKNNLNQSGLKNMPPFNAIILTESLLKLNSKESFEKMKSLLETLINKNVPISDFSKLHLFLLAINQNEPLYAMGFLTISDVDKSNLSLFKNLKSVVSCKLNNVNNALSEIEDILKIKLNVFSNEGLVFPYTLKNLKEKIEKHTIGEGKEQLLNRYKNIERQLMNENRISTIDLEEFSCRNLPSHTIIEPIDKRLRKFSSTGQHKRVVKEFEKYVKSAAIVENVETIDSELLNLVSKSILQLELNLEKLKEFLGNLKSCQNIKMNVNFLVNIFLTIIKKDPLYALEFLADFDRTQILKTQYPTIYSNILAIGFSLIDKLDIALKQVEKIVNTSDEQVTNENNFNGMIFQLTLNNLEQAVNRSSNDEYKNRFNTLKQTLTDKKRIVTSCDLISLPNVS